MVALLVELLVEGHKEETHGYLLIISLILCLNNGYLLGLSLSNGYLLGLSVEFTFFTSKVQSAINVSYSGFGILQYQNPRERERASEVCDKIRLGSN